MQTFRQQAGDSAEKLTPVSLTRESCVIGLYDMKLFSCTVYFTAKTTDTGVVLSFFSYRHKNLALKSPHESDSEDEEGGENSHDIRLCLLKKAAATSNGNLLAFLKEFLESDRREL